jgi:hypothetical protein
MIPVKGKFCLTLHIIDVIIIVNQFHVIREVTMLPRERVTDMLSFRRPDIIPLEYHPSPRGFYEYGDRLKKLFSENPGDFSFKIPFPYPSPSGQSIDSEGRYHEFRRDEWGTLWEYRLFCMHGHPVEWPLMDLGKLGGYRLPPQTVPSGIAFEGLKSSISEEKSKLFVKSGWISIFEKLIALRKFEDVLMDLYDDSAALNELADLITSYHEEDIRRLIALGVDAIQFGDDYGTQNNLIISPAVWRRFFKPRLKRLIDPVKAAGVKVLFHSCGMIGTIIDDLKEIGIDSLWPQLNIYESRELGAHCRELRLAVAVHIDRAGIMTSGRPSDVVSSVEQAVRDFRMEDGGAWFYVEIDNGFPFENIQALINTIDKYR